MISISQNLDEVILLLLLTRTLMISYIIMGQIYLEHALKIKKMPIEIKLVIGQYFPKHTP